MDPTRGEGHAVVGPDRAGQAELAEGAFEDRAGAAALGRPQALAGEQVARVLIGERERIAPDPVPRRELPLETVVQRSFGISVVGGTTPGC
jgi:hypothetical protein